MDKLVSNISKNISTLFNRKKLLFVGQHISDYNDIIVDNITTMKKLLSELTDGDISTYDEFQEKYAKVSRIVNNCMEYYKYIDNDAQYASFNEYKTTVDDLKTDFDTVYERIKPNSDFVNYSTDIAYNASVEYSKIAELSFAILFGYEYLAVDVGYATTKSCQIMFRIPPLGIFLFPSGYSDSTFWSDTNPSAWSWWNSFFNTADDSNSGMKSETYISNVRTNISYLLNNCKTYSKYALNVKCKDFIKGADDYTDDDEFVTALYNTIIECNTILEDFTLLERTQLLTYWSCKGICPKKIWFEMPYFPTYNHYNEFAKATAMLLNVTITTFSSSDDKTYFKVSYKNDEPSLSPSIYDDPTTSGYHEKLKIFDSDPTEQAIDVSSSDENSTSYITDIIFGEESKANGITIDSYNASHSGVQNTFTSYISKDTIDSTLSKLDKYTNYKNFMSAIDYICVDPNGEMPLKNLTGSKIGFRVNFTYTFITSLLTTQLNFPIVPYVGTNFINTWLMRHNGFDSDCLPQKMFSEVKPHEYEATNDNPNDNPGETSGETSSSFSDSSTIFLHSYALNGKVIATRTLDESCLFQSDE